MFPSWSDNRKWEILSENNLNATRFVLSIDFGENKYMFSRRFKVKPKILSGKIYLTTMYEQGKRFIEYKYLFESLMGRLLWDHIFFEILRNATVKTGGVITLKGLGLGLMCLY